MMTQNTALYITSQNSVGIVNMQRMGNWHTYNQDNEKSSVYTLIKR